MRLPRTITRNGPSPSPNTSASPPRVLQVVGTLGLGGAETMMMNLYRAVDRNRVQFDFLVFSETRGAYEAEVEELGGRIIRMPDPAQIGALRALRRMCVLMRSEGPFAAVHSHINYASGLSLCAAKMAGVQRRVAHAHNAGGTSRGSRRALYEYIARNAILRCSTEIAACGDDAGAYLFGPAWDDQGRTVHNAIDVARFSEADATHGRLSLSELGIAPDTYVLGCVARLTHQKNHAFVLRVIAALADAAPPVSLLLIGEGDLRSHLELEASRLGVLDRVLFLGARRDIPQLLKAVDLLVLPSHYEGLPVVLVEAQAAGLRCLVSDAVTREADLGLGLLEYLPLDVECWASRISTPSSGDTPTAPEIRGALARRGYSAPAAARELLSIYGLSS